MDAVTLALIKSMAGNGGGGGLPAVTSSDNGKVLGVVNGAWTADSNLLVVDWTGTNPDKTYAEIVAANNAGKVVICNWKVGQFNQVGVLVGISDSSAYFAHISSSSGFSMRVINSNGTNTKVSQYLLPSVSNSNNGSELIVKNGSWAAQQKKFIVTLTPTALDYSGTMDKTVAEINAAYEAGQQIVFRVLTSATEHADFPLAFAAVIDPFLYMNFGANFFYATANTLIVLETEATDDGTKQTYSTTVYSLTPAS